MEECYITKFFFFFFSSTENKVPKMWVGYVGVCLREITSWLWINQVRNDRSSCHYVEKHDLFISVCDYSCDGKCDLRCVTTNIISLTALAHNRTKRQPFCLAPSQCASILIVLHSRFIQHLWCHTKRSCHMLSFCPALTENALFVVLPMILIFLSECSRHYWVIAKPHASLLFFLLHTHTHKCTKAPNMGQDEAHWRANLTPAPPPTISTHTHFRSLSHWACCPEVTLSWIDKVS